MLFQACQQDSVLNNIEISKNGSDVIEFANYVSGMTRASRGTGDTFVAGDQMAVYGFQADNAGLMARLFNKQLVEKEAGTVWTYSPLKYWEKSSTYDFYAVYPYSVANSFDADNRLFTITDFTVADSANQQIDVMIAQQITDHQPFNIVNFVFNHILSNVNFKIKTSDDFPTTGISKLEVLKFDVTGLYSKGSFAQSGWNGDVFAGAWTADKTSEYDMPQVENVEYVIGSTQAKTMAGDLLMLPQAIDDNAKISISLKLVYDDGTEGLYSRTIALNKIVGKKASDNTSAILAKWDPNFRYNYIISFDPSITEHGGHFLPIANPDHDQDELNNQDPDNPIEPTVNIIKIDNDGDGIPDEFWIDEGPDDVPDYPIIWQDIDGDGKLEGLPDRDQDGNPDDNDEDGNPDVIWMDTDGDGILDTELERTETTPDDPDLPDDPSDPDYPTTPYVDYDGGVDGYQNPTAWLINDNGEYYIDVDKDGVGDIHILWKDIDGDGKLEGIADKDNDGKLTAADSYDNDLKDYNGNDNDYDVVLYKVTDSEGNDVWKELEKDPSFPETPEVSTVIEFSAEVTDWNDEYNANYTIQ